MLAIADGEDEQAEEHLSATLRLHPAHAPSLYQCARLVEKRGALHEAMLMYHTLVTSHERGTCYADAAARLAYILAQASPLKHPQSKQTRVPSDGGRKPGRTSGLSKR